MSTIFWIWIMTIWYQSPHHFVKLTIWVLDGKQQKWHKMTLKHQLHLSFWDMSPKRWSRFEFWRNHPAKKKWKDARADFTARSGRKLQHVFHSPFWHLANLRPLCWAAMFGGDPITNLAPLWMIEMRKQKKRIQNGCCWASSCGKVVFT